MADNEHDNDEYHFSEQDTDTEGSADDSGFSEQPETRKDPFGDKKPVLRNALMVLGAVIFLMLMYKIIGSMFFSGKTVPTTADAMPSITQQPIAQTQPIAPVTPVSEPTPPPAPVVDNDLKLKIAAIETSQQTMRSDLNALADQVRNMSNAINGLNTQIAALNQGLTALSGQVAKQSEEAALLRARTQVHRPRSVPRPRIVRVSYSIQAVIPGRAWLIGSNGSTLTVREGSVVPGYGAITLIDSQQGRILTTTGQVIKFSQEDS